MKKIISILLVFAVVSSFSCKKLDELTHFYMDYNTTITLPPNSVINFPFDLFTPDITTNYEEHFSSNDTRKDLVEEIKIAGISITAVAPQGQNLDFLKSITVYLSAEGLPEKEVASKNDIPDGLTTLELDYINDNLKEYLSKETIKLRVKTIADKSTNHSIDLEIKNHFFVNAKILGA